MKLAMLAIRELEPQRTLELDFHVVKIVENFSSGIARL